MPDKRKEVPAAAAIATIDTKAFNRTVISDPLDCAQVQRAADDYRLMLLCVLEAMLDRYERDAGYRFIDTKLNIAEGRDFDEADALRGKGTIYTWIQGRGLEALACHEQWLQRCQAVTEPLRTELSRRIRPMLAEVFEQMEQIRLASDNHLAFMTTPTGEPMSVTSDGDVVRDQPATNPPSNYSDTFYVKGMAAAAAMLGDSQMLDEARRWFRVIWKDILDNRFRAYQPPVQAHAKTAEAPPKRSHGSRMIAIGAAARFLEITGDDEYRQVGLECIEHIIDNHVNLDGKCPQCRQYDLWEYVDEAGGPCVNADGVMSSNPGHAIEVVGLGLEFTRICKHQGDLSREDAERIAEIERVLPEVLKRNLANGFSPLGYGVAEQFDLISRRATADYMPWWSLPEAMRAAVESCRVVGPDRMGEFAKLAADCSNAFMRYYIRPDVHLMAVQTLDADGNVLQHIPATPDADPGYHTGLSIIGCLDVLDGYLRGA